MSWKVSKRLAPLSDVPGNRLKCSANLLSPFQHQYLKAWESDFHHEFCKLSVLFQRSSLRLPPKCSDLSQVAPLTSLCSNTQCSSLGLPSIFLLFDRLASPLSSHPPLLPSLSHIITHLAPKVRCIPGAFGCSVTHMALFWSPELTCP